MPNNKIMDLDRLVMNIPIRVGLGQLLVIEKLPVNLTLDGLCLVEGPFNPL